MEKQDDMICWAQKASKNVMSAELNPLLTQTIIKTYSEPEYRKTENYKVFWPNGLAVLCDNTAHQQKLKSLQKLFIHS